MNDLSNYMPPLIKAKSSFKNIFEGSKSFFLDLKHGIIPHEQPEEAKSELSKKDLKGVKKNELNTFFQIALNMYEDSKGSIKSIEEKAFKLLTYISAISAILLFFLSKEVNIIVMILITVSLTLLVFAMVISLRCVGLKAQKALYISTAFKFGEKVTPKKERQIIAELMNFTVYNRNVASNTADILKAARHFLSLGIAFTVLSLVLFFTVNNSEMKINNVYVSFNDSSSIKQGFISLEKQLSQIEKLNSQIEYFNYIETLKLNKFDTLIHKMKTFQKIEDYQNSYKSENLNDSLFKYK